MVRPRKKRAIAFNPLVTYYKPRGVPLSQLEEVVLSHDEMEALRLKNMEGLDQTACADKMTISQSTFQRILNAAYKKISAALIEGKAIKIEHTEQQ